LLRQSSYLTKEINVDLKKSTRRAILAVASGIAATALLAGCGTSPGSSGSDALSYWYLSGQPGEAVRQGAIDRYNATDPEIPIEGTTFANEVYPTKLRTALGAGQGPTLIFGWGGGGLREFVKNDQVLDLTDWVDEHPELRENRFDSSWDAGTIDGKIYALPGESTATEQIYYNKEIFDELGVEPPKTWDDLMALVPVFNAAGIAPFALAGQSRWTEMMYLEFLLDRIGGPEVFQNVLDGKSDAWSDPAVIDALTKIQDLVKADGFIKGFSSIAPDSGADQALLYTGKAAMLLQGSWIYGGLKNDGGDFVSGGKLGYIPFPTVDGGKGDPSATVGNPAQYMSISSKATPEQQDAAKDFLLNTWLDQKEAEGWVSTGQVPVLKGIDSTFAGTDDEEFLNFVYDSSSSAKPFIQTWDQALSPTATEALLDNVSKIFQLSITPEQFVDSMNGVVGK
jgi:raffinose/stachyose/melibiose transport system substrate-binding protein